MGPLSPVLGVGPFSDLVGRSPRDETAGDGRDGGYGGVHGRTDSDTWDRALPDGGEDREGGDEGRFGSG